jgi:PAS domain S-box-containing protein
MRRATIGMAIVAPEGAFLDVNPALCEMFGRSEQDLRSASWQELTHPDDLSIDTALVQDVLDGRRDSYRVAKRYLRPDGSVVRGDLSVGCVRDADGSVAFFVSQIVDQTERVDLAERYRLLTENISDVITVGGNDGVVTWVSPSVTAVLGWRVEEFTGARWADLVHADDLPRVREIQQGVLEGRPGQFEARVRERAGSYRWMNIRVKPVHDDRGDVVARIAGMWDAQADHEASEVLAAAEARYGAALAASLDPHVFLDAVRDGSGTIVDFRYDDANASALDLLGRSMDELREASLLAMFPAHRESGMFARFVSTVETGEPLVLDEHPLRSEVLDSHAWFDFRGVKVLDGLSLSWRDVSRRVESRHELARAEERHRLLAENASDVVLRVDADGTIDSVVGSVEALLGRSAEGLRGVSALDIYPPEDLEDLEDRAAQGVRLRAGETIADDVRVLRPDGTYRWVARRIRAVMADAERAQWYVLALSDAQARVEYQQALRASEQQAKDLADRYERARNEAVDASREKTVFLSRMSHELRTPLNAILGFAQLLSMDDLTDDQSDAVHQIRTGGRHLLELISEVLDISRIESGRLSLSMESVNVADAVGEALDLVRPLAEAAGVTVQRTGHAQCSSHVWADRQRVIQILLNLLSNGVKYNRSGGSVEVWCDPLPGDLLALRVSDTGSGLTADQISHIFEPFDRLGAERTGVEGTGIGLTLSEALARLMSGRLEVTSLVGSGSVFTLVLPSATPGAHLDGRLEAPVEVVGLPRVDVLYVEDNPANIHLMERIAGLREGVSLRVATTGGEGIEAVAEAVPGLVLLDLHLPDMTGEAVLDRIRDLPGMAGVPVVVVTADASAGVAQRLTGLGAQAVLTKPIDVAEVLAWFDRPHVGRDG